ncbi:MAG: FtsX-like permease family protein [Candidatus Dormibacteria bacterium]
MKGVLVKATADLRRRKLQAAVVLVVVLLSSLAGTLALTLLVESDAPFDHAFTQANGAHLVMRYDASSATPAQIAATTHVTDVAAAGGPWPETPGLEVSNPDGIRAPLDLLGRTEPGGAVDRLTLLSGRWVQRDGEVVLARRAQKPLHAQVGDQLAITPGQGVDSLRVVGIAAAVNDFSDGWLTPDQATAVHPPVVAGKKGSAPVASLVFYRLHHGNTRTEIDTATRHITAGLPGGSVLDANSWLDQKRNADTTTAVMIPFLLAFSAFALVAAAMIIGNVVSGAVIAGYREIGIMKSIGFTPLQVVATLVVQMAIPSIAGAVFGIAGGVAAGQPFLAQTAAAFDLPPEPVLIPAVLLGCLAAVLAVVMVATVVPAMRAGRMSAAEAISSGSAPRGSGGRRAGRMFSRLPLPRFISLGMTDAVARPVRSAMTLVAVAIGVATITFAVGLTRSLDLVKHSVTHDQAIQARLYRGGGEGKAGPAAGGLSDEQVVALIQGQPGTARFVAQGFLMAAADGVGQPVRLFGYRGDARWEGYDLLSGHWFNRPGEAVVPQALLDAGKKRLGDSIVLSLDGRQERLRIVGVIFDTSGDNLLVRTDWTSFTTLAPGATPASYDIQLASGLDPHRYASQMLEASGDRGLDVRPAGESNADTTFLLIEGVLGGVATILTLIAMAGVFNTVVLNTHEKARDTAILKALGMTPAQVVGMVLVSVALIGAAGAIVGIPPGQLLHVQVLTMMGQIAAATAVPQRIYDVYAGWLLLMLAAVGIGVGAVSAWLPAIWAARGRVSEVLAAE